MLICFRYATLITLSLCHVDAAMMLPLILLLSLPALRCRYADMPFHAIDMLLILRHDMLMFIDDFDAAADIFAMILLLISIRRFTLSLIRLMPPCLLLLMMLYAFDAAFSMPLMPRLMIIAFAALIYDFSDAAATPDVLFTMLLRC